MTKTSLIYTWMGPFFLAGFNPTEIAPLCRDYNVPISKISDFIKNNYKPIGIGNNRISKEAKRTLGVPGILSDF